MMPAIVTGNVVELRPAKKVTRGRGSKPKCSLADIEAALASIFDGERRNVFEIGALLIAAKKKPELAHGQWLPWLEIHFGRSQRSAQRYMRAAKWAAKNDTVTHLKLKPGAIYWLMKPKWFVNEVKPQIFALAETMWVDEEDCEAALKEFRKTMSPQARDIAAAKERQRVKEVNIGNVVSRDLVTEFGMQAFLNALAMLPDERLAILCDAINKVIEDRKQYPDRFSHPAPDFEV
jgi:hypothetical protein